jgi:NADP-dependent 3-hydroxy acid dehydrogenase YdfG
MARSFPSTVLVTGASSGIGRALAVEYARRGAKVAVSARRGPELEALCRLIGQTGGKAVPLVCDVSDPAAAAETVLRADRELGSLDMVIANAGIGRTRRSTRLEPADVTSVVDVNVRGALVTLTAAIPIMLTQKHGQLVGISSLAGRRALPGAGAYSASKAALSSFLETLRIDLKPLGIGVTDVQPGFVDTAIAAGAKHPRPLQWSSEKAARTIATRLERAPRIIAFPWPLDLLTRLAGAIPHPLYAALVRVTGAAG